MPLVAHNELVDVVARVLEAAGSTPAGARVTAEAIGYAQASGIASHGLVRVRPLVEQLHSGKINGAAVPSVQAIGESLRLVDAQFGLGYAAAATATDAVLELLVTAPVAVAAVSRSHHFGVAGYYTERLAEAGFVGLAVSGTFGAIAPVGGRAPLLGNPPLSVAVPRADGDPVVVDLAPAVVARGNIVTAAARGDRIPLGWALDENGEPTDDPQAAMRGTLSAIGGGKGVILAMLADILVLTLTRSNAPGVGSSVFTADGPPPELGHVIIGFDPRRFGVPDAAQRVQAYVSALVHDGRGMRVAGERRRTARQYAFEQGVDADAALWADLLCLLAGSGSD